MAPLPCCIAAGPDSSENIQKWIHITCWDIHYIFLAFKITKNTNCPTLSSFFMNNKKNTIFGKSHNVWKLLKMSYFSFSFLAFPTNFRPLKIDCASEYHYFLHFLCFRNVCLRSTLAGFNPLSDAECSILHYVDDKCATPVLSNRENCWIISLTRNQILLISN